MTGNKTLKCPFCGAELHAKNEIQGGNPIRACCDNPHCGWFLWAFPWEIWEALIDGKKAQDVLKEISTAFCKLYKHCLFNNSKQDCHIGDSVIVKYIATYNRATSITTQGEE